MTTRASLGMALPLTGRVPRTADLLRELIDEVVAAERAGFDLCLIPEHRQGPDVSLVAPLTVAAAVAARTSQLRVATGILLAGVHHPVHLAEQMTMLDHLSRGRFVLGVGVGYQEVDFAPFGVSMSDRVSLLEETLASLDLLLTQESATFEGRFVAFDEVSVRPRPFSSPRPPTWVGAWSRPGIARAARIADGWIADPIRPLDDVARMAELYREESAKVGSRGTIVVMREAWVDDDDAVAAERFAPVIEPIYRYYLRTGALGPDASPDDVRFDELAQDRLVFGSAESCIQQADEVAAATGADHVVLHLRHPGGPDHSEVLARVAALGEFLG